MTTKQAAKRDVLVIVTSSQLSVGLIKKASYGDKPAEVWQDMTDALKAATEAAAKAAHANEAERKAADGKPVPPLRNCGAEAADAAMRALVTHNKYHPVLGVQPRPVGEEFHLFEVECDKMPAKREFRYSFTANLDMAISKLPDIRQSDGDDAEFKKRLKDFNSKKAEAEAKAEADKRAGKRAVKTADKPERKATAPVKDALQEAVDAAKKRIAEAAKPVAKAAKKVAKAVKAEVKADVKAVADALAPKARTAKEKAKAKAEAFARANGREPGKVAAKRATKPTFAAVVAAGKRPVKAKAK